MRFKAALIDLSGTLHIDGQAIPGAVAALERLRAAQLPCRFVTNTTKDTVDSLVMTLQTLGFGIFKDEVVGMDPLASGAGYLPCAQEYQQHFTCNPCLTGISLSMRVPGRLHRCSRPCLQPASS